MKAPKRWYKRWDLIGLLSLVLAAAGIGYSVYTQKQNSLEAERIACRNKASTVAELGVETTAKSARLSELEQLDQSLNDREGSAIRHQRRAQKYITALNAELTVGKTITSFTEATRSFKKDFGPGAFDRISVDTWVEYLAAAEYPSALTDRQRLARNMIDWGLESGAANFMVLTPRDEDTTSKLLDELRKVSSRMAVIRDENYLDGIQGIQDTKAYLRQLEAGVRSIQREKLANRTNVESVRTESRALEAKLIESKRQYSNLGCIDVD